jgi:hypothetical protein
MCWGSLCSPQPTLTPTYGSYLSWGKCHVTFTDTKTRWKCIKDIFGIYFTGSHLSPRFPA